MCIDEKVFWWVYSGKECLQNISLFYFIVAKVPPLWPRGLNWAPLHQWFHPSIGSSSSVLPMNIQGWFPLRLAGLISLQSKGLSEVFSSTSLKAPIFLHSVFVVQLSQPYVTTGKTIALTVWTFVGKVMSLLFNTLSRLVITFLPTSNHLLISYLQSPSAVILEPKERKSVTTSTFLPSIYQEVMGLDSMILVFFNI